ncbi:MAG: HYR domain-containing protein [Bacteroidota bacterium]
MNKQHYLVRFSVLLILCLGVHLPVFSQLELSVNQSDAIYNVGETAFFRARATYSATATYEIIYDNEAPVIESGSINLNAGQNYTIPYAQNEPGLVICRVNLNGVVREAAAAFAPLEIQPLEEEPSDFDAFWSAQKNLKNSLPMDPQISYNSETAYQTTYNFSISNIDGRRTYGYISVPKGSGPFPASITLPPYGSSNAVVGADRESAEKGGMIAVSLSIHNSPLTFDDPNAYSPDINDDRDRFYYRYALIGAMHTIDYLETRSDFDGNVCAMGVSQGGGLSMLLAGIDDRVSLLINSNPTMGQHVGYKYDRASGFPYYLSIADDLNQGNSAAFNATVNATKYYDAMFHARRFKGASYTLTGMKDLVVPSATALVSHNQLRGSKVLMMSRDGGHDHPNEYWNGRFEFMRRHFAGSNTPPFPFGSTNKGFVAEAGNNQTVGTSANLAGQIFYDNDQLNNLNVTWRKVSGPGNVNFSNANGYNTSANFSANGTYVLQFTGRDDRQLNNEGKVYYISDDVTITVTGGSSPTFTLDLNCPANQSVTIPSGQSQVNVSWSEPSATSNCSGGASYFQLAGPQNGSSFFEGNYTISYRATDNCGNQEDCSFTINVTQETSNNTSIDLICPSDIVVNAAPGDNAVTVSWAEPTATTSCNSGGGSTTTTGDCSSTFRNGYTYIGSFDNSQFYLSNGQSNWEDAKTATESEGGRLAIVNSAEENDFLQDNIDNQIVFIGLSDSEQEGSMRWVDGSSLSYNNFVSNPANSSNNDYVTLFPWNGQWDLNGPFVAKRYLLEIPCGNGGGGGGNNTVTIDQVGGNPNGSNFSAGTTTVSYTATDNCGNTANCSFNVTVNTVSTNLSIDCPNDFSVQIPAGQNSTTVTWDPATATSNCGGGASVVQTGGNGNGNQFSAGTYVITYQATDNCGNQEICSFTINVTSTPTDLSINCPANGVFQIPAGQNNVQINWNVPTASTSCPNGTTVTQISGPNNFSSVGAGNYTISYEATDNCGNREVCSFQITVNQTNTNLSLNCPSDQNLTIPVNETVLSVNWNDPTASGNCPGNVSINQTSGPNKFSGLGAGIYTFTFQATDNCGNSANCSFTITIEDSNTGGNGDLSINCPPNQTVTIPVNENSAVVTWNDPTASTTCTTTTSGSTCSGATIDGYQYMGTFEGSDYYKSNEPLSFPLAKTATEDAGGYLVVINSAEENEFLRTNIGRDLCIIGYSDEATEGTFAWVDGSNDGYSNFPANVNNNFSNDYAVINFWNGEWELTTDFIYKKYILEIPCNGGGGISPIEVNLTQIAGAPSGTNFSVGTTTISYEATDDCGNSETCSFTITVEQEASTGDNGLPVPVLSVASTTVSEDFDLTITFNEPVTSLNGYDLSISNANWYNFRSSNGTDFTVTIDPINEGTVRLQVPADVAFDRDIQGNIASNVINVTYDTGSNGGNDGGNGNGGGTPSMGSCVITPTSVVQENGNTVGGALNNIINGSGLMSDDDLNASHGGGNLYEGVWLNDGTDVTLRFDLGSVQSIDGIAIWNYSYHIWLVLKRRGVRDFQVSTSTDGINYTSPNFFTAGQTTNRGEKELAQVFNFPQTNARYVRLRLLNALNDSFYVGLGEVRFTNNCPSNAQSRSGEPKLFVEDIFDKNQEALTAEVFPNPTSGAFYLSLNSTTDSPATIEVINEMGAVLQRLQTTTFEHAPVALSLENEPSGLYFVRITAGEELPILRKIVKIK